MKKVITGITVIFICTGCTKEKFSDRLLPEPDKNEHLIAENALKINKNKNTIRERFSPPEGYEWVKEKPDSFGYFIENFKLKPYGSQILKYDGTPISTSICMKPFLTLIQEIKIFSNALMLLSA